MDRAEIAPDEEAGAAHRDLGRGAARGGSVIMGTQAAKFAVQAGGLIVLGRLLLPADFGLLTMVTAIVGIGDVLRDFGLSAAAVQSRRLSRGQASNLFWLNFGFGLLLAGLCAGLSPLIGAVYGQPVLAPVALCLSVTFVFSGLQTQFQAQLTRQMRYGALSLSDLTAQVAGLAIAILTAAAGIGYWALVLQLVTQGLALLILRTSLAKWRPAGIDREAPMGSLLRYGFNLMMTQSLVYASSNVDSFIVGAQFGANQLGFYQRAYQLLTLPLNQLFAPLTSVALPVLSRIQGDQPRFNQFVKRGQVVVAYPAVCLFAVIAASSSSFIPLVFGANWAPSAPIFQVLALGGAFQAVNYVAYWVFLAKGLTASHFRYSLVSRSLLITSLVAGSFFGPIGVAWGFTVGTFIAWPIALLWLQRTAAIPAFGMLVSGGRVVTLGASASVVGLLVEAHFATLGLLLNSVLAALATMLTAAALALLVPACRRDVQNCWHAARLAFRRRTEVERSPVAE